MDRDSLTRLLLIAVIMLGGYWFFFGKKSSESDQHLPPESYVSAPGFAPDVIDAVVPGQPPPSASPGETCTIEGNRFRAELSTHGAGLTHFFLTDARYATSAASDMVTTPDIERWRDLRTLFREPGSPPAGDDQVNYDRFDWQLQRDGGHGSHGTRSCTFTSRTRGSSGSRRR